MHEKRLGCPRPVYGKEQAYRGMQSLCAGYRGAAPCWGQGARPLGGLRAAAPSGQG